MLPQTSLSACLESSSLYSLACLVRLRSNPIALFYRNLQSDQDPQPVNAFYLKEDYLGCLSVSNSGCCSLKAAIHSVTGAELSSCLGFKQLQDLIIDLSKKQRCLVLSSNYCESQSGYFYGALTLTIGIWTDAARPLDRRGQTMHPCLEAAILEAEAFHYQERRGLVDSINTHRC